MGQQDAGLRPCGPVDQPRCGVRGWAAHRPILAEGLPEGARVIEKWQGDAAGSIMSQKDLLARYEAVPLRLPESEGSYQAWALQYFTNRELVPDPYIDITVHLDISSAALLWQERLSPAIGSLTAWLTWNLLQSLREFPCFQWRCIDGHWFEIQNPPLFCPIAVDGADRFANLILENPFRLSWQGFAISWNKLKQRIKAEGSFRESDASVFGFSVFIGNLPNLHFTSLVLHQPASFCQPFFYFGARRRNAQGSLLLPLAAKFHHASCDPHVLDRLLQNYLQRLQSGST